MNKLDIRYDLPVTSENLRERMQKDGALLASKVQPVSELTHSEVIDMIDQRHD